MHKQPFTCLENERESEGPLNSRATHDSNAIDSAVFQCSIVTSQSKGLREKENKDIFLLSYLKARFSTQTFLSSLIGHVDVTFTNR